MRYLIVLNANSPIGQLYSQGTIQDGSNDGFTAGDFRHPILDCTEIAIDSPYYIFAKRAANREGAPRQSIYVPHGSVVAIYRYDEREPHPLGFLPR